MFKLTLSNFKCFAKKTLEFPSSQIILLNGESGIGKTTILEAISFVLYDSNTYAPLVKTSEITTVELSFPNGLIISRQKKPNLLKLNYTDTNNSNNNLYLLDNAAQEYIFSLFGTENFWRIGAYLEQGSLCSFFSLTSNEKMNFLRELTPNDNFEKIMKQIDIRINDLVTEYRTVRNTFESHKLYYMQLYNENSAKLSGVALWTQEKFAELARLYSPQITNLATLTFFINSHFPSECGKISKEIENLNSEYTKYTLIEKQRKDVSEKLSLLTILADDDLAKLRAAQNSVREEISAKRHSISRAILLEKEKELLKNLDLCITTHELQTLAGKFGELEDKRDELLKIENLLSQISREELKSKIENIQREIYFHEYTEFKRVEEEFSKKEAIRSHYFALKRKRFNELCQMHFGSNNYEKTNLEKMILNYKYKLALIGSCQKLKCPKCDVCVYFNNNSLVAGEENESVSSLREKLSLLEEIQSLYAFPEVTSSELFVENSNLPTDWKYDLYSYAKIKEMYSKYDKSHFISKPEVISSSSYTDCIKMYSSLQLLEIKYKKIPLTVTLELINQYKNYQKKRFEREEIEKQYAQLKIELEKFATSNEKRESEVEIETLIKQEHELERQIVDEMKKRTEKNLYEQTLAGLPIIDGNAINEKIQTLRKKYDEFLATYSTLANNVREQELLVKMTEIYNVMTVNQNKYTEIEKEEQCLQKIKPLIVTAEYVLLDQVLTKINISIAEVLNLLFTSPILVELKSLRQLKTNERIKPEINVEIIYNGIEFGNLNKLSGGEKARISLAVLIAFSKFGKIPFLFLDESLSCLDANAKENAIGVIRQHIGNRTCIAINHDTREGGIYDYVINL